MIFIKYSVMIRRSEIKENNSMNDQKIKSRIKELETRLVELSSEVYEEWKIAKWIKYYDKEKEEYINDGYAGFEKDNEKCQEQKKLSDKLKELKKIVEDKESEELNQEKQDFKENGGVVIFVDGTKNKWGGKYGITDENGREIDQGNNSQIYEQIEIEAYAILKGVNWAKDNQVKSLKIMTDCQVLSYGEDFKSKTKAGKYFWLARKIAKESEINLEFEWVSSKENKADYLTRN